MRQLKRNSNRVEQVRCCQASSNAPSPNGVGVSLDFLHRLAEARPKPFAALGENGGRRRRNVLFWTDPIPVSSSRYFGADRSLICIIYAICNISCLSAGMGLTQTPAHMFSRWDLLRYALAYRQPSHCGRWQNLGSRSRSVRRVNTQWPSPLHAGLLVLAHCVPGT